MHDATPKIIIFIEFNKKVGEIPLLTGTPPMILPSTIFGM